MVGSGCEVPESDPGVSATTNKGTDSGRRAVAVELVLIMPLPPQWLSVS